MEQTVNQFFSYFIPLFRILFASVFVWFILIAKLYKILAVDHPQTYEGMGKPTLFWKNSPRSAWVLMKFVFKREYLTLRNEKLAKLGNFMFLFSVGYLILFAVLFVLALLILRGRVLFLVVFSGLKHRKADRWDVNSASIYPGKGGRQYFSHVGVALFR